MITNDLYNLIIAIDILFAIFLALSTIIEVLQISLDETKCKLGILEQIKDVDDAFKKNDNFKFFKRNTEERETYLFISSDKKFIYHEVADNMSNITMLFSTSDNKDFLLIHLNLHSKRFIRIRSTNINYFIDKLNDYNINLNAISLIYDLPKLSKYKFRIPDKYVSEILSVMIKDLESFRKND